VKSIRVFRALFTMILEITPIGVQKNNKKSIVVFIDTLFCFDDDHDNMNSEE